TGAPPPSKIISESIPPSVTPAPQACSSSTRCTMCANASSRRSACSGPLSSSKYDEKKPYAHSVPGGGTNGPSSPPELVSAPLVEASPVAVVLDVEPGPPPSSVPTVSSPPSLPCGMPVVESVPVPAPLVSRPPEPPPPQ